MNFIKISIITVCFNSEKTIVDTIESVINQGYDNIEYILIDGGSTDNTISIIKNYKEAYEFIEYISEPDEGIYDAFNKGIRMATGDIIGIINSDDWYNNNIFELIALTFQKNPNIGLVHGDMYFQSRNNSILRKGINNIENQIDRGMVINHPTVFVRKDIYSLNGDFDLSYQISADFEFIFRLLKQGVKFKYINYIISYMRDGGVSNRSALRTFVEGFKIRKRYKVNIFKNLYYFIGSSLLFYFRTIKKLKLRSR